MINTLIFEGGGVRGLSYIGALQQLEDDNYIDIEHKIHRGYERRFHDSCYHRDGVLRGRDVGFTTTHELEKNLKTVIVLAFSNCSRFMD